MSDKLNVDDLRNSLQAIEYSNISTNIDGKDSDCSTFISDLTIISDRTTVLSKKKSIGTSY
jgi:hypothetical protein